jgi:hypothetical protein
VTQDAPLRHAIQLLSLGASLSAEESAAAFGVVMRGEATPVQTAALLMGLRAKGETAAELVGAVHALRRAMVRLETADPDALVDTCGTGGGAVGTLNISTAAAFLVAGAGVPTPRVALWCPLGIPSPAASTPTSRTPASSRKAVKIPIAFEPPPTQATTVCGSRP